MHNTECQLQDERRALKLECHLMIEAIARSPYANSLLRKTLAGLKLYVGYKANRSLVCRCCHRSTCGCAPAAQIRAA